MIHKRNYYVLINYCIPKCIDLSYIFTYVTILPGLLVTAFYYSIVLPFRTKDRGGGRSSFLITQNTAQQQYKEK